MHKIGAHEPGEGERALDAVLGRLGEAQEQKGDEGNSDLDVHGILGGAEEAGDLEGLLDPAEEQLDGPAALVELGDLLGASVEIVGEDAQHLAGVAHDPHLAHRIGHRVAPAHGLATRQKADAIGQDVAARLYRAALRLTLRGVLALKRVTIRHWAAASLAHQA